MILKYYSSAITVKVKIIKKPQPIYNQIVEVLLCTQGGNRTRTSEKTGF